MKNLRGIETVLPSPAIAIKDCTPDYIIVNLYLCSQSAIAVWIFSTRHQFFSIDFVVVIEA